MQITIILLKNVSLRITRNTQLCIIYFSLNINDNNKNNYRFDKN